MRFSPGSFFHIGRVQSRVKKLPNNHKIHLSAAKCGEVSHTDIPVKSTYPNIIGPVTVLPRLRRKLMGGMNIFTVLMTGWMPIFAGTENRIGLKSVSGYRGAKSELSVQNISIKRSFHTYV